VGPTASGGYQNRRNNEGVQGQQGEDEDIENLVKLKKDFGIRKIRVSRRENQ
jgi:hypothetical protein